MLSITGVSRRTYPGTCKAANGIFAGGSSAANPVVCFTLVDICVMANRFRILVILKQCAVTIHDCHSLQFQRRINVRVKTTIIVCTLTG